MSAFTLSSSSPFRLQTRYSPLTSTAHGDARAFLFDKKVGRTSLTAVWDLTRALRGITRKISPRTARQV